MKKRICYILLMLIIIFTLNGCGKKTNGLDKDYYVEGQQEVTIQIEYQSNVFFAKYDIDIYIDNHKFYTVSNGDTNTNVYMLTKGTHVLKVASNTYNYASEEFVVENTGDMFGFSIKSHMNSIDLAMENSRNYYDVTGEQMPETADDSASALSENQVSAAKQNRTVWSYLWMAIKCVFVFSIFAAVLFICGTIFNEIFTALNAINIGILLELVAICALGFINEVTMVSFIVPVVFLIMWRASLVKIKKIPTQYRNFSTIKDSIKNVYIGLYSIVFAVFLLTMPNILEVLPIKIYHVEWYMYVYIVLVFFYVVCGLQEEIDYPERVRNYVEEKGIVGEKEIEEFVLNNTSDDASDEDMEDATNRMIQTLVDLAKIDLIEKDDNGECFRKKN